MKPSIRITDIISDAIMRVGSENIRTITFKDLINKENYTFEFFHDSRTLLILREGAKK